MEFPDGVVGGSHAGEAALLLTYELRHFSHKIKRVSGRGGEVWLGGSSPPPLSLTLLYASIPLWDVSCRQRVNLHPQTKKNTLKY